MPHWGVRSTNVLLFEGLRAKIADYDVLDQLPPPDDADHAGVWSGTAHGYLPPEFQMSGQRIPFKSDVYSFVAVLLELLTGRMSWDVTMDPHVLLVGWVSKTLLDLLLCK